LDVPYDMKKPIGLFCQLEILLFPLPSMLPGWPI
jgi:hypothetical protein